MLHTKYVQFFSDSKNRRDHLGMKCFGVGGVKQPAGNGVAREKKLKMRGATV